MSTTNLTGLAVAGDITATTATITTLVATTLTAPTQAATNIDAGASGTAGTVDIFPSTASKGKIQITATDSTGNTTTTITNALQAAARTYTIPDAGASASFVMTGSAAQTITGNLTVSGTLTNAAYTQTATDIDAGASGTAGSIDIFPTTASKGKLRITATDNTGDTTTSLTNAAFAQATAITLTDPVSATAKLHVDATQVLSGDGAITIKNGVVFITKGSAAAVTLADPTTGTDDGKVLEIIATTAFFHTVSNAAGSGFNGNGATSDVWSAGGALTGQVALRVRAYLGKWYVVTTGDGTLG